MVHQMEDEAAVCYKKLKEKILSKLLTSAAKTGSVKMVVELLKEGATGSSDLFENPVFIAVSKQNSEMVLELCKYKSSITVDRFCVQQAVWPPADSVAVLKAILMTGANLRFDAPPFNARFQILRVLLSAGYFLEIERKCHAQMPLYGDRVPTSLTYLAAFAVRNAVIHAESNVLFAVSKLPSQLPGFPVPLQNVLLGPYGEEIEDYICSHLWSEENYFFMKHVHKRWTRASGDAK